MPAEFHFRYNYHDRIELTPRHGKPKFKKNWKFEKILEGKIKKKKEMEREIGNSVKVREPVTERKRERESNKYDKYE